MGKYNRMLIYSLIALGLLTISSIFFALYLRALDVLTWGEFLIGGATLILGFATYFLGYTGLADSELHRKQAIELAEKERRRLRLKEQFEGLYSPLMSCIEFIDDQGKHSVEPLSHLMPNLRGKFEFLAKDDLKESLRIYYDTHIHGIRDAAWLVLIGPMKDAIIDGWYELSKEYDELTGER